VGASATASAVDPDPRAEGFRDTPGGGRHPCEGTETLWEIPRAPEGQPLGTGQTPSGAQNGRLTPPVLQIRLSSRKAAVLSCPLSVKRQAQVSGLYPLWRRISPLTLVYVPLGPIIVPAAILGL
jgi:hypothetical protein